MSNEKNRVFPALMPQDKADATTKVVRQIAEQDRSDREQKTAKLKALRLARDAEAALVTPAPSKTTQAAKRKSDSELPKVKPTDQD